MCALDTLQESIEVATVRLAPYVIQYFTTGYRVVKLTRTGETVMGRFVDREAAEDYLLSRLPQPAATRVQA
jgi:hypothetical protein